MVKSRKKNSLGDKRFLKNFFKKKDPNGQTAKKYLYLPYVFLLFISIFATSKQKNDERL